MRRALSGCSWLCCIYCGANEHKVFYRFSALAPVWMQQPHHHRQSHSTSFLLAALRSSPHGVNVNMYIIWSNCWWWYESREYAISASHQCTRHACVISSVAVFGWMLNKQRWFKYPRITPDGWNNFMIEHRDDRIKLWYNIYSKCSERSCSWHMMLYLWRHRRTNKKKNRIKTTAYNSRIENNSQLQKQSTAHLYVYYNATAQHWRE